MGYKRKFHKATGMPTHLDSIFFHWSLSSLLLCPESTAPVRGSTPNASQLLSPTNSLVASRYLFRPRPDFKSKNPLSGFAPKQTKESSAWRATYIVLHIGLLPCVIYVACLFIQNVSVILELNEFENF